MSVELQGFGCLLDEGVWLMTLGLGTSGFSLYATIIINRIIIITIGIYDNVISSISSICTNIFNSITVIE